MTLAFYFRSPCLVYSVYCGISHIIDNAYCNILPILDHTRQQLNNATMPTINTHGNQENSAVVVYFGYDAVET